MSEYTLSNSAAVIDSAITRVASSDAEPTANSQNMVTSGGVKAYVDSEVTALESKVSSQSNFSLENSQSSGYQVFENGLKMAWGSAIYSDASNKLINFPSGVNFTVPPTVTTTLNDALYGSYYAPVVNTITTTNFVFNGRYGTLYGPRYFAIGH